MVLTSPFAVKVCTRCMFNTALLMTLLQAADSTSRDVQITRDRSTLLRGWGQGMGVHVWELLCGSGQQQNGRRWGGEGSRVSRLVCMQCAAV